MNTTLATWLARLPVRSIGLTVFLSIVAVLSCWTNATLAATPQPLFDSPPPPTISDEVFLVSTRVIGTDSNDQSMSRGLRCQRLVPSTPAANRTATDPWGLSSTNRATWKTADWRELLSRQDQRPTIVYVHGNRVATGQDREGGLKIYRSFDTHRRASGPVRFIIWSWPSAPIPGRINDYRVKAQRTNPVAWQLAWLLDKFPATTPISLVGYSYGSRVVSGASHLLAGGTLGDLRLTDRVHAVRPPVRVALMAAAYDADWIQPGSFYSRALAQIERLILTTNQLDPAMRFYHLSNGRGRMHALGKSGVYQPSALGIAAQSLQAVDFTREVGRSHALDDYLAADGKMRIVWQELTRTNQHLQPMSPDFWISRDGRPSRGAPETWRLRLRLRNLAAPAMPLLRRSCLLRFSWPILFFRCCANRMRLRWGV